MTTYEVVVGETGAVLRFPLLDEAGAAAVPMGNVGVDLLGASEDLPGVPIVVAGQVDEPANEGVFERAGAWITVADLGAKRKATFKCNMRWTDADGEHYQPPFNLRFVRLDNDLVEEENLITPYETRSRFTCHRSYNFATLPATKRNTFAGASLVSRPPRGVINTAGLAIESNKSIELMPESYTDTDNSFGGVPMPNATQRGDVRHSIRAHMGTWVGGLAERALMDAAGFAALGFGSYDANVAPTTTADCAFFQVRKSLKNPLEWRCVASPGNGGPIYTSPVTTLTNVATEFTGTYEDFKDNGGEMVEMRFDPYAKTVRAWVRGILICELSDPAYYPVFFMSAQVYPCPVVSFVLFSGVQTAPVGLSAMLSSLVVEDYGTTQYGAGLSEA